MNKFTTLGATVLTIAAMSAPVFAEETVITESTTPVVETVVPVTAKGESVTAELKPEYTGTVTEPAIDTVSKTDEVKSGFITDNLKDEPVVTAVSTHYLWADETGKELKKTVKSNGKLEPGEFEGYTFDKKIERVSEIDGDPVVEYRFKKTVVEVVPFDTLYHNDDTLDKGVEKVVQEGVDGERVNGEITKTPIAKVIYVGTKEPAKTSEPTKVEPAKTETKTSETKPSTVTKTASTTTTAPKTETKETPKTGVDNSKTIFGLGIAFIVSAITGIFYIKNKKTAK